MSRIHRKGVDKEAQAVSYLEKLGYTIITRNYRVRGGEIDIICLDNECLVFVEVRSGKHNPYFAVEETINTRKKGRIIHTAESYMSNVAEKMMPMRFDVITITGETLKHYKNAFN